MRMLTKELKTQFDQVSNTIFTLGEGFAQLYNHAAAFNNSVSIGSVIHEMGTYLLTIFLEQRA